MPFLEWLASAAFPKDSDDDKHYDRRARRLVRQLNQGTLALYKSDNLEGIRRRAKLTGEPGQQMNFCYGRTTIPIFYKGKVNGRDCWEYVSEDTSRLSREQVEELERQRQGRLRTYMSTGAGGGYHGSVDGEYFGGASSRYPSGLNSEYFSGRGGRHSRSASGVYPDGNLFGGSLDTLSGGHAGGMHGGYPSRMDVGYPGGMGATYSVGMHSGYSGNMGGECSGRMSGSPTAPQMPMHFQPLSRSSGNQRANNKNHNRTGTGSGSGFQTSSAHHFGLPVTATGETISIRRFGREDDPEANLRQLEEMSKMNKRWNSRRR